MKRVKAPDTSRAKLLAEIQDLRTLWEHYRSHIYEGGFTKRQKNNNVRKLMSIQRRIGRVQSLILSLPIEETPTPK